MILVTGGTGFLGSELIRQLVVQGKTVRAIKRPSSTIPENLKLQSTIDWRDADLLNYHALNDSMDGVTQVYHCAAMVSFRKADKRLMRRINIEGTAHVVNVCLQNQINKLIHVSSVSAVGYSKAGELITEKHQWQFNKNQSNYAISKYESEMEVFRGIAEGLKAVIINPSIIIGKNAGLNGSGQLFKQVKEGLKYYPQGAFGIVDVQDVAAVMIRLMEGHILAKRFIINAENISYKDLFATIAEGFKLPPPSIELRPWMLKTGYLASSFAKYITGKDSGLTKEIVNSASKISRYSNQKITNALNYNFKPVKQTILEICESPNNTELSLID
ncbi:MAG: NAD-dependent epimerase/dehydratase family protein [Flavobacterium sp.]|nr:NAD-dependent epimerase/dehydratase family protein [Pedobacter sp.]